MTISIEYEAEEVLNLPYREVIENTALAVLGCEGCPYEIGISVIPTGNNTIQEINRGYRRIDVPTDVLSFPIVNHESPSDFNHMEEAVEDCFSPEVGELMLGDIVISIDEVEGQAEKRGHSQARELVFLTVHSTFHLFDYGHMEDGKQLVMEEKQKEILETRGCTR